MAKKIFIASKLTASTSFAIYDKKAQNIVKRILINGGNSLVNRHLQTLEGAITEITEDDLKLLEQDFTFNRQVKNGFLKVTDQPDAAKASSDLESRDTSAPLQQEDVDAVLDDAGVTQEVEFDNPKPTRKTKAK